MTSSISHTKWRQTQGLMQRHVCTPIRMYMHARALKEEISGSHQRRVFLTGSSPWKHKAHCKIRRLWPDADGFAPLHATNLKGAAHTSCLSIVFHISTLQHHWKRKNLFQCQEEPNSDVGTMETTRLIYKTCWKEKGPPEYSINLEHRSKHLIQKQYSEIQFSENMISKKTNWK